MNVLANAASLVVQQKKQWGEILTGFEQRNKYLVSDPAHGELLAAVEDGGSILTRQFLRNMRPFEMSIVGLDGTPALHLHRPFAWYFHTLEIRDARLKLLGRVRREFSWLRRVYTVQDGSGREAYRLYGPAFHPWTFEIRSGDRTVGRIVKKWSGAAKEAFTKADNFGVTFPTDCSADVKAVLLGAVFLIDFVHFEHSE
jgi:uncharacterized protein YxjI